MIFYGESEEDRDRSRPERLASIIKACRDIMRKDKGLNGDLDRLPMLTWIMFLKFLDDMEKIHETEAQVKGKPFVPAIEPRFAGETGQRSLTASRAMT